MNESVTDFSVLHQILLQLSKKISDSAEKSVTRHLLISLLATAKQSEAGIRAGSLSWLRHTFAPSSVCQVATGGISCCFCYVSLSISSLRVSLIAISEAPYIYVDTAERRWMSGGEF